MSRGRVRAGLAALALALAGCAVAPGPTPAGPTPGATVASSASPGTPSAMPSPTAAASGPRWTVETLSENDPTRPVHLQWPVVPGATTLNALLADEMTTRHAAFLADAVPADEAPPELRGTWETVLDAPAWVGVRLAVYEFAGASGSESTTVVYGERTAGRSLRSAELIAPTAHDAAATAIVDALRAEGRGVLEELVGAPSVREALLRDLTFGPRGELVARIDEGTVLPFSDGVVQATVPAAAADGMLSEEGWAVREAVTGIVASPAPTATPDAPAAAGPAASVDCAQARCVALTFDDGPGRLTGRLLDDLAAADVPATFFVLGTSVRVAPDVVRRMVAEGHEVGNHTYDHLQLTKLGAEQQRAQVARTASVLADAGVTATVFRPPYGSHDATTREVVGLPVILWDVDTLDWKTRSTEATVASAVGDARAGSIVLMHDIHEPTVAAVPAIVAGLREKGFTLVTVSQLLGETAPGSVHSRR